MEEDELFYTVYRSISIFNEQDINYFYLDSSGHLTIGHGHCVAKRQKQGHYIWQLGKDDKQRTLNFIH